MSGKSSLKSALLALQFLTIVTLVPGLRAQREELTASLSFFPLTGLLIGGLTAALVWALSDMAGPLITGTAAAVFLALITRGLHLDGLADSADAVGSGAPALKALEIMKDSCSGALGVIAVVCVLMLKAASAVVLSENHAWQWLVLVPALSRFGLNCLSAASCYARKEGGLGSPFCGPETRRPLAVAALTALAAAWFLKGWQGVMVMALAAIASLAAAAWARRRFGGVTGDLLGAHLEITETWLLVAAAIMSRP